MPGVGLVDLTRERIGLPALTKARSMNYKYQWD